MSGGIKIPETLFLSQWVVRGAPQLLGAYPKKDLDYNLIIDLFGLILREEEEPKEGFYIVQYPKDAAFSEEYGGRYFVCYFSGMELRQLVGLILEPKEDPGPYRGALVREALRLFRRGEVPSTDEEWERIWNAILTYPQLPLERRIADIFRDIEARIILTTMINEGVTTLDELVRSVRNSLSTPVTRDLIVSYVYVLSALGILEVRFDEKTLTERVYLVSDVIFYRRKPPKFDELLKQFSQLQELYTNFVSDYLPSWEADFTALPDVLGTPNRYALIERFREAGYIRESDLTPDELKIAKELMTLKILVKIDDNIVMLSDPTFRLLFPKWTIARAMERAKDDENFREILVSWLNVLREAYLRKR